IHGADLRRIWRILEWGRPAIVAFDQPGGHAARCKGATVADDQPAVRHGGKSSGARDAVLHTLRERVRQPPLQVHAVVVLRRPVAEVVAAAELSVGGILEAVVLHLGAIEGVPAAAPDVIVHDERFDDDRDNQRTLVAHFGSIACAERKDCRSGAWTIWIAKSLPPSPPTPTARPRSPARSPTVITPPTAVRQ